VFLENKAFCISQCISSSQWRIWGLGRQYPKKYTTYCIKRKLFFQCFMNAKECTGTGWLTLWQLKGYMHLVLYRCQLGCIGRSVLQHCMCYNQSTVCTWHLVWWCCLLGCDAVWAVLCVLTRIPWNVSTTK